MSDFKPRHDLQLALFTMFSQRLVVRDQHEALAEVYQAMDLDGDGVISERDFLTSYEIYYTKSQAKFKESLA